MGTIFGEFLSMFRWSTLGLKWQENRNNKRVGSRVIAFCHLFACVYVYVVPGDVGIVSYASVTQHVGGPLGHQHFDLVHRAAEL